MERARGGEKRISVVWLSANRFGYELLKEAKQLPGIDITAIVTLSDDAETVMYDGIPFGKWGEFGLPIHRVKRINDEDAFLRSLAPDLIMMCGWRQIISKEVLAVPPKGIVGFHPTLLPIGRGPAPLINSILNGFTESGLTMFYVGEGLDDGDIIGQERYTIESNDHADDVYEKIIIAGRKLVAEYLPRIADGTAPRNKQNNAKATYFEKLSLKNNEIDLERESAERIFRKIRALSHPYKGAYLRKDGKKLILWRAELQE
jgi:methionyl-tRNA formyltransferase